jgi:hypothetical protein
MIGGDQQNVNGEKFNGSATDAHRQDPDWETTKDTKKETASES